MRRIRGVAHHYAWGDRTAIPHLLGLPADGRPWAELWFGTHHGGSASLLDGHSLIAVAGELPYLLKVLAAAEPLSMQTHPDAATASAGFDREDAAGIALHDPARTYRDRAAKPELVCALTSFEALCGFRPVADTVQLLRWLGAHHLASILHREGLEAVITGLYRGTVDTTEALQACAGHSTAEALLVSELAARYPGDPSVVVTLLLNRVTLAPGQALFLGPGNLHAYLAGTAVEVMGASDNVVRGGLTRKHVDVEELLAVLRYEPLVDPVTDPVEVRPGQWHYPTGPAPFEVWRFDITDALTHTATGRELLLCTDGDADAIRRGQVGYLAPGDSVVLEGTSTVFRVTETT